VILLRDLDDPRRRILVQALAAGLFSYVLPSERAAASLFGKVPRRLPPGRSIYELRGEVAVNGVPATLETRIEPNNTVETGPDGYIVFVVGEDAFLVRGGSKLVVSGSRGIIDILQCFAGRVLSVFGRARHQVRTSTAIIGVRGTGVYFEADPEQTYFCTCYGVAEMRAASDPTSTATVAAQHHDDPKYIVAGEPVGRRIRKAPFKNHTDEELMILEATVGRTVPFSFSSEEYRAPRRDY
jgi:hypothetical protein